MSKYIASPLYFWLLWLIPFIILFYIYIFRKKDKLIREFCQSEMLKYLIPSVSRQRQKIKAAFIILGIIFIIIALARPRWGFHWEEIKRVGVDIVVAVDVSESMRATDVPPTRLERAKYKILDLIKLLEGDRIGIVAFAGTSFIQCPLTLDYGAAEIFLDNISTDMIPIKGTAIAEAIRTSISAFSKSGKNSKALILITDGEDHQGNVIEAAQEAKKQGITIFAIGIGKEEGVPIPNPDGEGFIKDKKGNVVISKLDEKMLQRVALETGGAYVRSVTGDIDLEKIYKEEIKGKMEDSELKSNRRQRWEERFQWACLIAIIFLASEPFISERKKI